MAYLWVLFCPLCNCKVKRGTDLLDLVCLVILEPVPAPNCNLAKSLTFDATYINIIYIDPL